MKSDVWPQTDTVQAWQLDSESFEELTPPPPSFFISPVYDLCGGGVGKLDKTDKGKEQVQHPGHQESAREHMLKVVAGKYVMADICKFDTL